MAAAYNAILRSVRDGAVVPLDVGDAQIRHAVMVIGTKGGELLVHDPGYGQTGWVTRRQFVTGTLDYFQQNQGAGAGGWSNALRVALPVTEAAPGLSPTLIVFPEVPGLLVWITLALGLGAVGTIGDLCFQTATHLKQRKLAAGPAVA